MAKRGRKKKNKVTSLSSADKGHLKRILAKVRQIKANKKQDAPSGSNGGDLAGAQQALSALQANFNRFVAGASPTQPGYQSTFDALAKGVATQQAIVFKLLQGR